ncbi:MAG: hypothetical protein K9M82_06775 [Deltaproteobacteria bacterium]|nr:hypothetical protein [Deltaproteobacteria bacterium]
MLISKENREIRDAVLGFERRIETMHLEFQKYRLGEADRMPEWERLEREILAFSRRRVFDLELSNHLDRVMHKFQNRKKIWLRWAEEYQHAPRDNP